MSSNFETGESRLDRDELLCVEVGLREVHGLAALVGDGDGRHQQVAVALVERIEDAFPRRVDELDLDAGLPATAFTTSMSKPTTSPFSFCDSKGV
jgi:hypothetical protein